MLAVQPLLAAVAKARSSAADKSACDADRPALLETLFGYVGEPARSTDTLRHWGAPATFAELTPAVGRDQLAWTLSALPYMRDRLTLPDLLVMSDEWTPELIDRVIDRAGAPEATADGPLDG